MVDKIHRSQLSPKEMQALARATNAESTGPAPGPEAAPQGTPGDAEPINKVDLNLASEALLQEAGFAPAAVLRLRSMRPHFSLAQAAQDAELSPSDRDRLQRLFTISPLQFADPASGGACELRPCDSEWVVKDPPPSHGDGAERWVGPPRNPGGALAYRRSDRRPAASDLEGSERRAFPAFTDKHGQRRYLDPRYLCVQLQAGADPAQVDALLQSLDLYVHRRFDFPGLLVLRLGSERHGTAALAASLLALQGSPLVQLAEPAWLGFDDLDARTAAPSCAPVWPQDPPRVGTPHRPSGVPPWNLKQLQVAPLWAHVRGHPSVTLACVDTGIDSHHPALQPLPGSRARREALDFSGEGPEDQHGHGTGVAGLMVGQGGASAWGLAPGCSLLSLKVSLLAQVSSYASRRAALMRLVARAQAGERLVVNLSWRTNGDVALVRTAIEALAQAGALIVCSAGNGGLRDGSPHHPSDYPQTLSVAASDAQGQLTDYSNLGPEVDLVAPGGDGQAALLCAQPGGGMTELTGTSFAAPQVAASAGLIWSLWPELDAHGVGQVLLACAQAPHGHPVVLHLGALAQWLRHLSAEEPVTPAPPPSPEPGPGPGPGPSLELSWPVQGSLLLARGKACPVRPISRRILSGRAQVRDWQEVAQVLGMEPAGVDCLRQALAAELP